METTWKPSDALMQIDRTSMVNWSQKIPRKNCYSICAFWYRFHQVICFCWYFFLGCLRWKNYIPAFPCILNVRRLVVSILARCQLWIFVSCHFDGILFLSWCQFDGVSYQVMLQTNLIQKRNHQEKWTHLCASWILWSPNHKLANAVCYGPYVLVDVILMLF